MTTRTDATLNACFENQLANHLAQMDAEDAEREYLEDLERELDETGIVIGHDEVTRTDAELAFYEAHDTEFDELQEKLETAGPEESAELLATFNAKRDDWISETFMPQVAERIRKEEISCFGWEGDAA